VQSDNIKPVDVEMDLLHADYKFNCRGIVLPQSCLELADSIKQRGLLHPIHVRVYNPEQQKATGKKFQIVAGYRRHMAAQINKQSTIPCVVHEHLSDIDARIMNLDENITRQDLDMVQEANAVKILVGEGLTQDEIGKRLGRSRGWAQVRCMLVELPQEIQELAAKDMLSNQQIRDIYSLPTYEAQYEAARKIKESKGKEKKVRVKSGGRSYFAKVVRDRDEIFEMMEHFYEYMEPEFVHRVMAWCAGEISTVELLMDFKTFLKDEKGIKYEIPEKILPTVPVRTYAGTDN